MSDVALWIVMAQESCESSGGCVTLLIATGGSADLPDVHAAFRRQRGRDCNLHLISKIELLGEFSVDGTLFVDIPE